MSNQDRSSIFFRSNLMPRAESTPIREDLPFLSKIWDHQLLERLKANCLPMTAMQEKAYQQTALHCMYAPEGDYPFGTVRSADGTVRVVCKCTNTICSLFTTCRPEVDPAAMTPTEPLLIVRCDAVPSSSLEKAAAAEPDGTADREEQFAAELNAQITEDTADDLYTAFLHRVDPPDSLRLEAEYAAVLWPQDLGLLEHLIRQADQQTPAALVQTTDLLTDEASPPVLPHDLPGRLLEIPAMQPEGRAGCMPKDEFVRRLLLARREKRGPQFAAASQEEIIRLPATKRTIINAGPGTGKTWTLIERIIALTESGAVAPEEIQVLCFSRSAHEVVVERLREAARTGRLGPAWQKVEINTFDSYAAYLLLFLRDAEPRWLPCRPQNIMRGGFDQTMKYALTAIRRHPQIAANLRHLIVDEIQDLVGVRAEFLLALTAALPEACGFTFLGDSCQSIYDFSVGSNQCRTDALYQGLCSGDPLPDRCSFDENRRSTAELAAIAGPYRKALLSGRAEQVRRASQRLRQSTPYLEISWDDPGAGAFGELCDKGTLAVLTRSNGAALAVSTQLHHGQVAHELYLAEMKEYLGGWIGRLLLRYGGQTLDSEDFADAFAELYPQADPLPYWEALTGEQRLDQSRYEIRDLLQGIRFSADSSQSSIHDKLLRSPEDSTADVRVMTIHKAKGQEFDTVLVPETTLTEPRSARRDPDALFEEGRVAYVALTRARTALHRIALPPGTRSLHHRRASKTRGLTERWYNRTRAGMQLFEIGATQDMDPKTFAAGQDVQEYLLQFADSLPGLEVGLQLEDEDNLVYTLSDRDRPGFPLARTGEQFALDLSGLLAPTSRFRVALKAPDSFRDIYVRRVVTHVGPAAGAPEAARIYGDVAVWLGLQVIGLAKADYDRY